MRLTWCSAVLGLMNSRSAISRFERPSASSRSTSFSRRVRSSLALGPARPFAPSERMSAAAASASRRAPSASSSVRACRAASTATSGDVTDSERASSRRVRAASSRAPSAANRFTPSSSISAASSRPSASAMRPRAAVCERLNPVAALRRRDLVERRRGGHGGIEVPLKQPRLDELRQQRRGKQARPADLVEPVGQECRSGGRLASLDTKRHSGLYGLRFILPDRQVAARHPRSGPGARESRQGELTEGCSANAGLQR